MADKFLFQYRDGLEKRVKSHRMGVPANSIKKMPLPQKLSPLHFIVILVAIIASLVLVLWLKPESERHKDPVS